jgi:hypothetical protein
VFVPVAEGAEEGRIYQCGAAGGHVLSLALPLSGKKILKRQLFTTKARKYTKESKKGQKMNSPEE